VLTGC